MRKLIPLLILGAVALAFAQDGPLTNLANLPIRTDANGYVLAAAQTYTGPDGPRRVSANAMVRTDANGYLIITNPSGFGGSGSWGGISGTLSNQTDLQAALDAKGPVDAQYWTGAADAMLSAEKNLGALSTALVINTSGVPSAYAGVTCTNQFLRILSAIGAGTCASVALTDTTGIAPSDAGYWVDAANGTLSAERNLGGLTTGLVLNTVTASVGVPSAYAGTSCTNQFLRSLNGSGAATCASVSLTADVSGDLPYSSLAQGSALSVLGVTGNATADVASIAAASDFQVLRRSGTALAFGAVNLASTNAITGLLPDANLSTNVPLLNAANTFSNAQNIFANLAISDPGAGVARLRNVALSDTAGNAALTISAAGSTTLNAPTGQQVSLGINNGVKLTVDATTISEVGELTVTDSDTIASFVSTNVNAYLFIKGTGTSNSGITFQNVSNDAYFGNTGNGFLSILTNNTDRIVIKSSGEVGIGTGAPAGKLDVNGTAYFQGLSASGVGDTYVCLATTKELRTGATCAASTQKIKDNILPLQSTLATVMALTPISFTYKANYQAYRKSGDVGFLAEQVARVHPALALYANTDDVLSTGEKISAGDPIALNLPAILSMTVKAVQEQQAQIVTLQARLDALTKPIAVVP